MAIEVQPAVLPHLIVDDAAAAIDFYVKAFGAVEVGRVPGPDGKLVHAALAINGSTVMLNDDFPEMSGGKSMTPKALGGSPVTIHLVVTDVDAKFPAGHRRGRERRHAGR
jgi:PhnB protein